MSRLRVTLKTLHLLGFSARLLSVEFFSKFVRSFCRADASELELMVLKVLVASANVAILEFLTALERWFSYKRNNKGPRIDPWGTPKLLGLLSMLYQEWLFVLKSRFMIWHSYIRFVWVGSILIDCAPEKQHVLWTQGPRPFFCGLLKGPQNILVTDTLLCI